VNNFTTTETDPTPCPSCERPNELHTGEAGHEPKHGDVSICWGCQQFAIFVITDDSLTLRLPTAEELDTLNSDPNAVAAQSAVANAAFVSTAMRMWNPGHFFGG